MASLPSRAHAGGDEGEVVCGEEADGRLKAEGRMMNDWPEDDSLLFSLTPNEGVGKV